MIIYRIVEFRNEEFAIQKKKNMFSRWQYLPYESIITLKIAQDKVEHLKAVDQDKKEKKLGKRVKAIHRCQ